MSDFRRRTVIANKPYDAEIEYLESTGTQYIDTGIDFYYKTQDIEIGIDVLFKNIKNRQLFGSNGYGYLGVTTSGSFECAGIGNAYINAIDGEFHKVVYKTAPSIERIYLTIDNKQLKVNTAFNVPNVPYRCFLFAIGGRDNAAAQFFANAYLKSAYIKIDNTLVRDLIPVRIGQIGYMYDRISKQLFGNSGTGDFILGPDL